MKAGNEHKAFYVSVGGQRRVLKITHPGKFGRKENTPFQYLLRWQLLNDYVPTTEARIEDCIRDEQGRLSIITTMSFYQGPHPEPLETDAFIKSLGFEMLRDGSSTLDYIHGRAGLIIRDCHPRNWIRTANTLVPIDIIPEAVG